MKIKFDVTVDECNVIQSILLEHLPSTCKVWVLGSHTKDKARFNSDIDLALESEESISSRTMAKLRDAFDDATLAFKVDVLDINNVEDSFRKIIDAQKVEFPLIKKSSLSVVEGKVPQLRFKEFSDEWEEKKIIDIAPLQRGFDLPVNKIERGTYPVVFSNGILKTHSEYKAKAPGVVTGRSGTIGTITYVTKDYWPHNTTLWVTDFKGNNTKFIYYFYLNCNLEKISTGSGVPTLNRNNVHTLKKFLPTPPEQEKIASFLTAVDKKIELVQSKIENLQLYKKALMQKIFSQEIRFKQDDGSNFPDWEEKKIKDLFVYKNGGSFEKNIVEKGLYKLITLNSINISGELKSEHKRVNINDGSLAKDDLIMVLSDVAHGNFLGLTAIIPEDNSYVLNQRMGALKSKTSDNISFIRMYINYNQKYFKLHGQGSSQQNLSKGDIEKFVINLPCLEEQTKIGNFLSAIDKKIEEAEKQLAGTKEFKKGLLQQMFV